jgi:hypothetical protein
MVLGFRSNALIIHFQTVPLRLFAILQKKIPSRFSVIIEYLH